MSAIASKDLQDIDVLLGKVSAATGLSVQAISKQLDSAEIQAKMTSDKQCCHLNGGSESMSCDNY